MAWHSDTLTLNYCIIVVCSITLREGGREAGTRGGREEGRREEAEEGRKQKLANNMTMLGLRPNSG